MHNLPLSGIGLGEHGVLKYLGLVSLMAELLLVKCFNTKIQVWMQYNRRKRIYGQNLNLDINLAAQH